MQLIINADDLGYSPHRDAAIFELFRMGKITSASLIVNGPTAATASERARLVGLPIGLHLNLTEGEPLTSGLVKADGKLAYKMEFRRLAHCAPKDFEISSKLRLTFSFHISKILGIDNFLQHF
jgi:predicted glycoside hydrolase/deacetylase ChbG (UPF0249 family)